MARGLGMLSVAAACVGSSHFLMLQAARSGSDWLMSMLNSHPDVCCDSTLILNADIESMTARGDDIGAAFAAAQDASATQLIEAVAAEAVQRLSEFSDLEVSQLLLAVRSLKLASVLMRSWRSCFGKAIGWTYYDLPLKI